MVKITSFARLNFGLIDLSDKPHRIDGCHGIYTNLKIGEVTLRKSDKNTILIANELFDRCKKVIDTCREYADIKEPLEVIVDNEVGAHIGLGCGTQFSMSIVQAFDTAFHLNLTTDVKAYLAGSGGTSSIGVYGFEQGGYILDAGRLFPNEKSTKGPGENYSFTTLAPLLARYNMPDWYICIALPETDMRIYGDRETQLFQEQPPIPENEVDAICKWILKGIMPAILSGDFQSFSDSLEIIMNLGFRAKEINIYGKTVKESIKILKQCGLNGVGMSSFGPIVFGFAERKAVAEQAYTKLKHMGRFKRVFLTNVRNKGAEIKCSMEE